MAHDPAAPPLRDFRLGDWLVQPSLNRLVRGDTFIHFRPKVMDVLVCLASRAGEVVAKEAIVDAVWAKEFIADSTFSRAIFELRESLGDDPQHPTYLETIPKRGYRLLAPVEMLGSPAAESCPRPEPRQRLAWLALAAVGLALVAAGRLLVGPSGSERTLEAADALVRKGYVQRVGRGDDRRFVELELTNTGNELLDTVFEETRAWMRERMEVLNAQVFVAQSRADYYQALYGYQLAWADMERAVGGKVGGPS